MNKMKKKEQEREHFPIFQTSPLSLHQFNKKTCQPVSLKSSSYSLLSVVVYKGGPDNWARSRPAR